jgi:hypothetical protein
VKTIWKYGLNEPIPWGDDSSVVHVGLNPVDDHIAVWIAFDTNARHDRALHVEVVGTGHQLPDDSRFLGTVRQGVFMWHVFGRVA